MKDLLIVGNNSTSSLAETQNQAKQGDEPSIVGMKGSTEPVKSFQVKLQACEKPQALPFIHPTDVFQRVMEEEEREREKNAAANPTEGMLNRRHPLRTKRKNRRIKREAVVGEEKRMLYPDGVSSSGALSIGISI